MPKDKSTGKKLADMMYGNPEGAAFGITPFIGKRREDRQDREAAKSFPVDLARGVLAGAVGIPGDIESLARLPYELYTGNDSPTFLPTSEDVLKRIPFGSDTPASQFAAGLGTLAGGSANLGAIPRAVKAAPGALKTAARNLSAPRTMSPEAGAVRVGPPSAPQEKALRLAQQRAKAVGQSEDPRTRMLQQGYDDSWYHGTTGDISNFRTDLLGETTGANSAKKGFFFARDPLNPPESMLKKSNDPAAGDLLRKMGIPEEEIAKLNTVSMEGHGPETASGYALIGGSREYKEAMRKAKAAERRGDWPEYEKQMQIAEDSETTRMQYGQGVIAKYGDARDEMLEGIKNVWYGPENAERFKNMSQADYEAYDKRFKELMPYGWYNSYSNPQLEGLKKELVETVGEKAAEKVLGKINKFQSVRNERALIEKTQEGGNVMPVALRYENPMVYDFEGRPYRDQSYSDLVDQALMSGNDALILKNTYDPGGGPSKLIDVGVVFEPDQIRSRFAAFDPLRKTAATAAAAGLAAPDLLAEEAPKSEVHISDNPDVMMLELARGGAVHMQAGGLAKAAKALKAAKAAKAEKTQVPIKFPVARGPSVDEIRAMAERMAPQVTGEFVRAAPTKSKPNPSENVVGKSKQQFDREKNLQIGYQNIKPPVTPSEFDYAKHKDELLIGASGDVTPGNRMLVSIDNQPLSEPVHLQAGPEWGLYNPSAWAATDEMAKTWMKRADMAADEYNAKPHLHYHKMTPDANWYAMHHLHSLLGHMRPEELMIKNPELYAKMVDEIRTKDVGFGKHPEFVGFEDPLILSIHTQVDPNLRRHLGKILGQPTFSERYGLRSGQDVMAATSLPDLRDLEVGSSGYAVVPLDTKAPLQHFAADSQTYDTGFPMAGPVERSKYPIPYQLVYRDTLDWMKKNPSEGKSSEFGRMSMIVPKQQIDDELIDAIGEYQLRMKALTGKKKGGAVRKAAGGEITADDLILEERKL